MNSRAALPLLTATALVGGFMAVGPGTGSAATPGDNGLIAFESTRNGSSDIYVKAADGTGVRQLTSSPSAEVDPAWSPDGRRIAYSGDESAEGHQNIWVMNADGSGKVLLTPGARTTNLGNAGTDPSWSPDGSRIVWSNYGEIWVMSADGGGRTRLLGGDGTVGSAPAWSPDGGRIAYISGLDIWTMTPDGGSRTRITSTTTAERAVDWSPDGSALVFERGGQIWRMRADGTGAVALTASPQAGQLPAWSPDGRRIAFGTNAYGSTTAHEIAVMNADGTGAALVPAPAAGTDTDPSWQPLPDTTPPVVTARAPAVNATAVATAANVTATFSEPVQGLDGATFALTSGTAAPVAAAVTYNATTRVATLNPTAALPADTRWTATLTGGPTAVRDLAGNPLTTVSWTFTTGPRPTAATRTPAAGATGVLVGSNVTATFSEAVQGVSGTTVTLRSAAGTAVAAVVTYDAATRRATLNPNADLARGSRYTATLTGSATAIHDLAGNPLTTVSWSFTTQA
jgi:dipeptidyl aminopeptidase/acylaminoacyl peptidase